MQCRREGSILLDNGLLHRKVNATSSILMVPASKSLILQPNGPRETRETSDMMMIWMLNLIVIDVNVSAFLVQNKLFLLVMVSHVEKRH